VIRSPTRSSTATRTATPNGFSSDEAGFAIIKPVMGGGFHSATSLPCGPRRAPLRACGRPWLEKSLHRRNRVEEFSRPRVRADRSADLIEAARASVAMGGRHQGKIGWAR